MSYHLREHAPPAPATAIEWEECACLLCGSENYTPLVEAADRSLAEGRWFLVVQCRECGLCFTNPRPTLESMAPFYGDAYPPHQAVDGRDEARSSWFARRQPRKTLALHGEGRLLDFGCGNGSYLLRMHRQGWKVVGIDQAEAAVQRVRRDLQLPALVGSLPHEDLRESRFDVITMWQALEHVHSPAEVLAAARRLLAPGGKLIVAVPNIDSAPFRWFGQAWNGLDLPRHLTHFAPWTLHLMLHRAGFQPGPIRMLRRSGWVRASAQIACRFHPNVPRVYRWMRGRPLSNLASWYSYLTRQSDCMIVTSTAR